MPTYRFRGLPPSFPVSVYEVRGGNRAATATASGTVDSSGVFTATLTEGVWQAVAESGSHRAVAGGELVAAPDRSTLAESTSVGRAVLTAPDAAAARAAIGADRRLYRRRPPLKMVSTMQSGDVWSANVGTWTYDTADYALGTRSLTTTTAGTGVGHSVRLLSKPTVSLSNKNLAVLMKVSNPVPLSAVNLYVGNSSLANNKSLFVASGGASANSTLQPNVWQWVHFTPTEPGATAGTYDATNITDWQLRVIDTAAGTGLTAWFNAVAHYDRPSAYPNGVITIAFDDNYASPRTNGLAALDKYGWAANQFVIVDGLGTSGMLTQAQLDELQDRHGHEIGGHAYTAAAHNAGLITLSTQQLEDELGNLKSWLLRNGYKGADLFAYPLGDDNASVMSSVGRHFTLARQIVRTPSLPTHIDQPLRLRSYSVSSSDTLAAVQAVVDRAYTAGTWLVLTFHQIVTTTPSAGTQWPAADFASLMDYIAGKGMPVETMGQVLDTIR